MRQDEDAGGEVCDLGAWIRDGEGTHGHVHLLKREKRVRAGEVTWEQREREVEQVKNGVGKRNWREKR